MKDRKDEDIYPVRQVDLDRIRLIIQKMQRYDVATLKCLGLRFPMVEAFLLIKEWQQCQEKEDAWVYAREQAKQKVTRLSPGTPWIYDLEMMQLTTLAERLRTDSAETFFDACRFVGKDVATMLVLEKTRCEVNGSWDLALDQIRRATFFRKS